jgi:integrase
VTQGVIDKAWQAAREDSGIGDFRFHDLRHSAASYLAMSGASLMDIAAILGHKTLGMVKRYSHLSEQHTTAAVDRMAERFLG